MDSSTYVANQTDVMMYITNPKVTHDRCYIQYLDT
jgi:hypothetical protein